MDLTTKALLVSVFFFALHLLLLSFVPQRRRKTDYFDPYENWSAEHE